MADWALKDRYAQSKRALSVNDFECAPCKAPGKWQGVSGVGGGGTSGARTVGDADPDG